MIAHNELPFSYKIRRSQRALRARIVVKSGQVEIVAPLEISEQTLHQFIWAKQQWVSQTLRKMAAKTLSHHSFVPEEFKTGAKIIFQGNSYPLTIVLSKLKRIKVEFKREFIIYIPDNLSSNQCQAEIKSAFIQWLKKQAKIAVEDMVNRYGVIAKLRPKSITIRTQKSRWGSCGPQNDININWLLLIAPKEVMEYVVVHELCHIQEKNHSSRFWALVADNMPDYQQRRQWLKKNGHSLMLAFAE